jgi:hypothetical protein
MLCARAQRPGFAASNMASASFTSPISPIQTFQPQSFQLEPEKPW